MSGSVIITLYQKKVQISEKVRIDVSKTFAFSGRSISSIVVKPEHDKDPSYDVTNAGFLDVAYDSAGIKTIHVTLTLDNADTIALAKEITVVSEATENLFSFDSELLSHEPDLMNYLSEPYCDYRYAHRLAQSRIMAILDERGITDTDGNRIVAADVKDIEECNDWSKFLALQYIFESLSNAIDDIFADKANRYKQMVTQASNRAYLRLDYDSDGTLESTERGSANTGRIYRR
tara:strand:- start:3232 stop:3930 length:699 start_codon:yes stop_codon:yes gene_type:complete